MNASPEPHDPERTTVQLSSPMRAHLDAARALGRADVPLKHAVMGFEAPYLLAKLQSTGLVAEPEQARMLFDEVKKYLLLSRHLRLPLPMSSSLVDAAWHQFVLFSREYEAFCLSCLGAFFHHVPEDPLREGPTAASAAPEMTRDEFIELYEASFGELPAVWSDSECLRQETRLRHARETEPLSVAEDGERTLLLRGAATPEVVCRASRRARSALTFLATYRCFLVRELPGLKTPEERVALCRPLVRYGILRIAV